MREVIIREAKNFNDYGHKGKTIFQEEIIITGKIKTIIIISKSTEPIRLGWEINKSWEIKSNKLSATETVDIICKKPKEARDED